MCVGAMPTKSSSMKSIKSRVFKKAGKPGIHKMGPNTPPNVSETPACDVKFLIFPGPQNVSVATENLPQT